MFTTDSQKLVLLNIHLGTSVLSLASDPNVLSTGTLFGKAWSTKLAVFAGINRNSEEQQITQIATQVTQATPMG